MQIFDIYTYNFNQIKFRDNKEYLDNLLAELGLRYSDVGFCFWSDYEGSPCEKATRQFKSLAQYKKCSQKSESYPRSLSEHQMSSISVDGNGGIDLYIDRDHIDDFGCLLKKVPRPINFGFMGVILDNISWSDDFVSRPCYKSNAIDSIAKDHRFSCYYSNSIRFVKEFDYGNKLNLVEVLAERDWDFEKASPHPKKFDELCARLGKLISKRTECVFDKAEAEKLELADETLKRSINKNEYAGLFAEFKRDYPKTAQGVAQKVNDSLVPMQGISPKKSFTCIGKKHGFKYKKCINGCYELTKTDAYNHTVRVSFGVSPFSSLLSADISICGHNFNLLIASFPEVIIDGEAQVELYSKKVFEIADEIEEKFTEKLFLYYGKTPDWYDCCN